MKRHVPDDASHRGSASEPKHKKRVTFQDSRGAKKHEQGQERGNSEAGFTKLATKKWTTAVKPGLAKNSSENAVDPEKRDALASTLDLKSLFEYLNSSDENALEIALAAFYHRIEQDHQSKIADNAAKAAKAAELGQATEQSTDEKNLLPDNSLMQQYLEHSPETNELWTIWQLCLKKDKTKTVMATMLIFVFSAILKFTTWPHLQHLRSSIARTFTKSHIHVICSNLTAESPLVINAALSLLTESVHVSPFHARDLFTAFNWSQKSFFQLVSKKNASYEGRKPEEDRVHRTERGKTNGSKEDGKKEGASNEKAGKDKEYQRLYLLDVRTHYIQFGLAFLEHNDASLTHDVLAVPGFLSPIFKDMAYDATALILQTFETLHEYLLLNKAVSKASKAHFFNYWVLSQIATIYKRFTSGDKLGALASLTRNRIQAFLDSLLTSSNDGIIYYDLPKPFPPAAQLLPTNEELALNATNSSQNANASNSRNRNILKFIMMLHPQDSQWHERLVLKVLEKDTKLAKQYFEDLKLAIEPRPENTWLNNITYLMKLLDLRPMDLEPLVNTATTETTTFSFDRVVSWYVPPCCLQRTNLSAGLRHANLSVRFATMNLIHRILGVLDDVSVAFKAELSSSPQPENTLLHQIWEGISNQIKRKVPDLDTVLIVFNGLFSDKPAPVPAPTAPAATATKEFTLDVDSDMIRSQIMILMSDYLRRFPDSFLELNFDLGKLFTIASPWTEAPRVQDGLLTMLESASSRLRWNSYVVSTSKQSKVTQIGYLLHYLINSSDEAKPKVMKLCREMLLGSGLFDRSPLEVEMWLAKLATQFRSPFCVQYFETAIVYLSQAPHIWADEMAQLLSVTDAVEVQSLWRLPNFPTSFSEFPFSLLMLAVLKDHAHILTQTFGGPSQVDVQLQDPETWMKIVELGRFLNAAVMSSLIASELPLPLIYATVIYSVQCKPIPTHDVRAKSEPLPKDILETPLFTSLFFNLRGFLCKIFGVLPPSTNENELVPSLGIEMGLPPSIDIWASASLNLHTSIFEAGPVAEQLAFLISQGESLEGLDLSGLDAVSFTAHLFSAAHRQALVNDPSLRTAATSVIVGSPDPIAAVQVLLFFISIFFDDEHSGDCLQFSLEMVTSIFNYCVDTQGDQSASKTQTIESDSTDETATEAKKDAKTSKSAQEKNIPAVLLKLILGNPSLNTHFLRDISSHASQSLSFIISQLLEVVIFKSAHHLIEEVKELATVPLLKLAKTFDTLVNPELRPEIAYVLPLIKSNTMFMFPEVFGDILKSISSVPPKKLLSEKGLPLLEVLVQMFLHLPPTQTSQFKLSISAFPLETHPLALKHVVCPTLLPEMTTSQQSTFEVPPCSLDIFGKLLQLHSYATSKMGKLEPMVALMADEIDQIVFRLLLSSFTVSHMTSASSKLGKTVTRLPIESLPLGDPDFINKILGPQVPVDFPALLDKSIALEIISSMKKLIKKGARDTNQLFPMQYKAAILSLCPFYSSESEKISNLLSTFEKSIKKSPIDVSLDGQAVLKDIEEGSAKYLAKLQSLSSSHSHYWSMLIFLRAASYEDLVWEDEIAAAFKHFAPLVCLTGFHAHVTGPPLHQFLLDFGLPIFKHFSKVLPGKMLSMKEMTTLGDTFVLVATSKSILLTQSQLEHFMLYSPRKRRSQVLVAQCAAALQSISTAKPGQPEYDKLSALLNLLLKYLYHYDYDISQAPAEELVKIMRRLLRFGYECSAVLDWISLMLRYFPENHSSLHDLLVSHSSFVKLLMLRETCLPSKSHSSSMTFGNRDAQCSLLKLLCAVYEAEPEKSTKFSDKMLALYLSAYQATLSPQDQLLLHIIMIFERHGINFSHAGFLWGTAAQDHKSRISDRSQSSQNNANGMDVDEDSEARKSTHDGSIDLATFQALLLGGQLVQHRTMLTTIRSFSPYLPMETSAEFLSAEDLFPGQSAQQLRTSPNSVYDARFLLSVYYFGMNFFADFDCKKFVETGGLSLVFQTLSSNCENLRKLGYTVLSSYSTLLDQASTPIREASQLRLLITVLRAAIAIENYQLSSITSSFLGEASLVLIRHDHPLFLELHSYLLSRPQLSLNSTPILKRFLISSRNTAKAEKEWALRMVECGLRAPQDLPLVGLRYGNIKATQHHILATLIAQLSSNLTSSFGAIAERHRIWSILCKMIIHDAPSYKNTLLGPGGIAPFLNLWTLNHAHHMDTSSFSIIPSAAIASPAVYAEVATVLKTIAALPELETNITKSRPFWLQFQPIIGNILHYLQLSYAKLGSLQKNSFGHTLTKNDPEGQDDEVPPEQAETASHNIYWKLLAPCITLMYHFATNLSIPSGVPTEMLKLAFKFVAHLKGSFVPVSEYLLDLSDEKLVFDRYTMSDPAVEAKKNLIDKCSNYSAEQLSTARHYIMLASVVLMDRPESNDASAIQDWMDLAQLSIRIVLRSPSSASARFLVIRTLLGQLSILATTKSNVTVVQQLASAIKNRETSEATLLQAILSLYIQHPIEHPEYQRPKDNNMAIVVLLNTLCTLIVGNGLKDHLFEGIHHSWTDVLQTALPGLLSNIRTLSTNTLHEASMQQFCSDMSSEEIKSHQALSRLFRILLAADLSQEACVSI